MFFHPRVGALVEATSGRRWEPTDVLREVDRRIRRYARHGLGRGDRVFLHFGNRLEFFAELLAVWRLGGCVVPIDARLTPFELETLVAAASPRCCVTDDGTAPEVVRALGATGVTVLDTLDADDGTEPLPPGQSRLDDDALILFTSGSTGNPKGVVHTHRSLLARWTTLQQSLGLEVFARTLCLLPTHFGHGLICNCLYPWLAGQDLFITPPFRPDLIMRLGTLLDEHRITFMSSVPSVWRVALKMARAPQGGSLRRVHVGSAPLSASLWEDIRRWTGTPDVLNAYGITETGSWVAGTTGGPVTPTDGLVGEGWGATIQVRNTADTTVPLGPDTECAPGDAGYVWLKTPALMKGYFDRDDLTAQVVADGWFMTGDIGLLDDRGRLHLRGRERDEINKGGLKIYPSDVDAVVERFDRASDVCAFALDDPAYGQNVGIAVVLTDREDGTVRELHQWMKRHLAEHKMPVRWYLVDEIPRTSRGKVNRDAVKQACEALTPLDVARIAAPAR
ncbi:MAG TPA: class I adenylate-forming enzyme family protein [Candidatus Binatia bacterium]|jgi:acyl-CoA synthetase (AMP-forming)/AMP-acid ligase II|nr:class I adenylate-forming enzyme family protein [Candidatus Binatia bacterium]